MNESKASATLAQHILHKDKYSHLIMSTYKHCGSAIRTLNWYTKLLTKIAT